MPASGGSAGSPEAPAVGAALIPAPALAPAWAGGIPLPPPVPARAPDAPAITGAPAVPEVADPPLPAARPDEPAAVALPDAPLAGVIVTGCIGDGSSLPQAVRSQSNAEVPTATEGTIFCMCVLPRPPSEAYVFEANCDASGGRRIAGPKRSAFTAKSLGNLEEEGAENGVLGREQLQPETTKMVRCAAITRLLPAPVRACSSGCSDDRSRPRDLLAARAAHPARSEVTRERTASVYRASRGLSLEVRLHSASGETLRTAGLAPASRARSHRE